MRYILFLLPLMLHSSPESLKISAKKEATSALETQKNVPKTINIKNSITSEMLMCNHWTGNHKPESFSLTINGITLKEGETTELKTEAAEMNVTYQYSFAKGLYKGSRTCKLQVPNNTTTCSLAFSWKKEPRVWLEAQS